MERGRHGAWVLLLVSGPLACGARGLEEDATVVGRSTTVGDVPSGGRAGGEGRNAADNTLTTGAGGTTTGSANADGSEKDSLGGAPANSTNNADTTDSDASAGGATDGDTIDGKQIASGAAGKAAGGGVGLVTGGTAGAATGGTAGMATGGVAGTAIGAAGGATTDGVAGSSVGGDEPTIDAPNSNDGPIPSFELVTDSADFVIPSVNNEGLRLAAVSFQDRLWLITGTNYNQDYNFVYRTVP